MATVIEEGRSAPLRGSLSRDDILAAGLKIARSAGLGGVNMRDLARELGVTPMAIYHHFESKRALIEGVIDRYVCETAVTKHEVDKADWRGWIKRTFLNTYRSWQEAPGTQHTLSSIGFFGPGLLRLTEDTLEVLIMAGVPKAEAVRVCSALTGLTMGRAILQAMKTPTVEKHQWMVEKGLDLDAMLAKYPVFRSVIRELGPESYAPSIEFELDLVLDSIERLIERARAAP
jgi:AcrR family transcriptional regulator